MASWDIFLISLKQKLREGKNVFFQIVFPFILTSLFITVFSNVDQEIAKEAPHLRSILTGATEGQLAVGYKDYLEAYCDIQIATCTNPQEARKIFERGDIDLLIHLSDPSESPKQRKDRGQFMTSWPQEGEGQFMTSWPQEGEGQFMTNELRESGQNLGAFTLMSERYMQNVALRDWHYKEEGRDTAYSSYKEVAELQTYKASQAYRYISLQGERETKDSALSIGVTMIAFTILLAASYGADQIAYIREALGQRLLTTPLSKVNLYLGEYLGGVAMSFLQGSCLVLALEACFHLGLGRNMSQLLLIILSTSFMSIALGLLIGIVVRDTGLSNSIVSLLVLVFCFTSGGMVPTAEVGVLAKFSPVTLMNEAFIGICQKGSYGELSTFLLQIGALTGGLLLMSYILLTIKKGKGLKRLKTTGVMGVILLSMVGCGKVKEASLMTLAPSHTSSQKLFLFHNQEEVLKEEEEQLLAELKSLPLIENIEEWRNTYEITVKTWEDKEKVVELTGLSGEGDLENKLPLEAGRFFTKEEAETGVPVLVVLDTYAKIMWGEEKPEKLLRKQVLLEIGGEKKPFQIIGIFDTGVDLRKDLGAGTKPGIYMSLKTYDKLLGMSPEKSCYALNLKEEVETAEGYKAIEEVLCRYGEKNDYTLLPYCGKVVSLKLNP